MKGKNFDLCYLTSVYTRKNSKDDFCFSLYMYVDTWVLDKKTDFIYILRNLVFRPFLTIF